MEQDVLREVSEEDRHEELEEQEFQRAEEVYESFFGEGTEEEQLRIRELAARLNIRDNDALWIIIYVLNYFGRFYHDLPEKLKDASGECLKTVKEAAAEISEAEVRKAQALFSETLTKSTEKILSQYKRRTWLYDMFLPLAWCCMGVFFLCLVSFVGGAAVAGKGWGQSPLSALLNAPAGWIVPLALIPAAGFALYRGLTEDGKKRYMGLGAAGFFTFLIWLALNHIF